MALINTRHKNGEFCGSEKLHIWTTMHIGATLDIQLFCCLVLHDGYLGFSMTNVNAPETLLIGMMYLNESKPWCTWKKVQVPVIKVTGSGLVYIIVPWDWRFLKLHNLVEFWSVDHLTVNSALWLNNISWLYCSHEQFAEFLRLIFVSFFQLFAFRLFLVSLLTKRGWSRLFHLIPR